MDVQEYKAIIGYIRVSTAKQEASGLGQDAQRNDIERYAQASGLPIIEIFIEVESGRRHDRRELQKAIDRCRHEKALLVIARLDRLARSVYFTSKLIEEKVPFICCDMPNIDHFGIHILAAVAEQEAKMISKRTKAALAAAKKRGVRLGNPNNWEGVREKAKQAREENARSFAMKVWPQMERIIHNGASTFEAIADELNHFNIKARKGGKWYPATVQRTLSHLEIRLKDVQPPD